MSTKLYAVKASHGIVKTFAELEEAKREAMGFLLSHSREKKVEIVELFSGLPFGGPQNPIWILSRKRSGATPTWKEIL